MFNHALLTSACDRALLTLAYYLMNQLVAIVDGLRVYRLLQDSLARSLVIKICAEL
jgi:hypothetical protein